MHLSVLAKDNKNVTIMQREIPESNCGNNMPINKMSEKYIKLKQKKDNKNIIIKK